MVRNRGSIDAAPAHASFHAMGCDVAITAWGANQDAVASARARIDELERRWSRFLFDSEVSQLNDHAGADVIVSSETFTLVHRSVTAWHLTGGLFDPTCGTAMVALGYDRDIAQLAGSTAPRGDTGPLPGCEGIVCDPDVGAIRLPAGVRFDPGGIGKGLAADIVAAELLDGGATGAVVDIGGDVAVRGEQDISPWLIEVVHQLDTEGRDVRRIALGMTEGGVTTSSILRRRWATEDGPTHHVVDPATGANPRNSTTSATVIAASAWWAEAQSTALLVGTWSDEKPPALTTDASGDSHHLGAFDDYLWAHEGAR